MQQTASFWRRLRGLAIAMTVALVTSAHAAPASVDSSTVRVFAIGTVGTTDIEVGGDRRVAAQITAGHGTGFFVEGGLVMTAHHVVAGARHVVVRLPGSAGFHSARVLFSDDKVDVAVLALDTREGLPASLDFSAAVPRVRANVFAIGYPLDPTRTQPQSARGIVAGFLDDGTIQLDMALNPGNSGGPVVDENDAVIAMAVARGDVDKGVQGVGFAVPAAKLLAALAVAKQHLVADPVPAPSSRDSATVVDQLVQQGALYALRGVGRTNAELERALAALLDRINDADLLVCVAGVLWNTSLEIDGAPADPARAGDDQARAEVAGRLRAAALRFVRRAVQLDGDVGARSAFVGYLLTRDPVHSGVAAAAPAAAPPAVDYARESLESATTAEARAHLAISAAPIIRYNPESGSLGWGYGAEIHLEIGNSRVAPFIGAAFGTSSLDEFSYSLVAAELGIVARAGKLDISGAYTPCWYDSSVESGATMGSVSAITTAFRLAADYRLGHFAIGAGVRALSGPTLWIEPVSLTARF